MPEPTFQAASMTVVNKALVDEFELDPALIRPEARLREDLGLDSLDGVDLIVALEKACVVQIAEDEARQMRTVGDVYAFIDKASAAKS